MASFLPQRGNYRSLIVFRKAECIYDITFYFAQNFLSRGDRTVDQMIQAARSGKQNIAEGCSASTTSRETEIKLLNVAKASLQELLLDYEDYLRVRGLSLWDKDNPRTIKLREKCLNCADTETYMAILPKCDTEMICNLAATLIHQTDVLLKRLIDKVQDQFLKEGGIREQMTRARLQSRNNRNSPR